MQMLSFSWAMGSCCFRVWNASTCTGWSASIQDRRWWNRRKAGCRGRNSGWCTGVPDDIHLIGWLLHCLYAAFTVLSLRIESKRVLGETMSSKVNVLALREVLCNDRHLTAMIKLSFRDHERKDEEEVDKEREDRKKKHWRAVAIVIWPWAKKRGSKSFKKNELRWLQSAWAVKLKKEKKIRRGAIVMVSRLRQNGGSPVYAPLEIKHQSEHCQHLKSYWQTNSYQVHFTCTSDSSHMHFTMALSDPV